MMGSPYLVAMEHSEWHAGKVLKKHHKNRPLGRIENEYHYSPPQPVLSCRSAHVDLSGTRTYRSRSNTDIIEEQHKIIHNVYTKARNIASAPPSHSRKPSSVVPSGQNDRVLTTIQVQGRRPHTALGTVTPDRSRPSTAKLGLKKRPSTAGSPRKVRSATDTHLRLLVDPEVESSSRSLHEVQRLVQDQWDDDNHGLEGGEFVKGKKKEGVKTSLDPKTGNQWLVFGGGQLEKSAGVVDAFTAMKGQDEYYTIDGSTGSQVARQLHRGDQIRIGINGSTQVTSHKFQRWNHREQQERPMEVRPGAKPALIPLCWDDQVGRAEAKVLEPTPPRDTPPRPNLCESHPVIFKKLVEEDVENKSPKAKSGVKVVEGYKVKAKTKPRVSLDGNEHVNSTITSIVIGKHGEGDNNDVSYDEILRTKIIKPKPRESEGTNLVRNRLIKEEDAQHEEEEDEEGAHSETSSSGKIYEKYEKELLINSDSDFNRPNYSIPGSLSRPTTAFSGTNQESDIESLVVLVGNNRGDAQTPKTPVTDVRSARTPSGGRPPPAKPHLHKTIAAVGATVNASSKGDPEFIQISSQMQVSKDRPPTSQSRSSHPSSPRSMGEGSVSFIDQMREHNLRSSRSQSQTSIKIEGEGIKDQMKPSSPTLPRPPTNTPPGSRTRSPDFQYAFNIPTGQALDTDLHVAGDRAEH